MARKNRRTASKGLTLKVYQIAAQWKWRVVTDHNGETVSSGFSADKTSAITDGTRAFYIIKEAAAALS
jgi:hypothetical protein